MAKGVYPRKRLDFAQRFWAKVRRTDTCWVWLGALRNGYGQFQTNERSESGSPIPRAAHRIAYELTRGPIDDECLDHICRNRACVNPDHLEAVSMAENKKRGRLTVCRSGRHAMSEDNVSVDKRGSRACRLCRKEYQRTYYASKQGVHHVN